MDSHPSCAATIRLARRSAPSPTSTRACRFGLQLKGASWGRPGDRIGLAGAWNTISPDHSRYLAVGGLGVLVGDGRLNYASENVIETFYALQMIKGLTATVDYQLLVNPAYNADRGPVHVFSGRLHATF